MFRPVPARWAAPAASGLGALVVVALLLAGIVGARATNSITLPFQLRQGHLLIPARVNEAGPRQLMLDTGYSLTMLEPGLAAELGLRRAGRVTIVGIAGEEEASQYEGPTFAFAGLTWTPRRVAAFPAGGSSLSGSRAGVLGSGFFRRFAVEINWTKRTVTLHEPGEFRAPADGVVIPLRFRRSTPILEARLAAPGEAPVTGEFELDIGCDGALCLGQDFAAAHGLGGPRNGRRSGRTGVGGGTSTRTRTLERLELGGQRVDRPEANIFDEGSPADPGLAGHIGLEALRGFHLFLDYSRRQLVVRPRSDR